MSLKWNEDLICLNSNIMALVEKVVPEGNPVGSNLVGIDQAVIEFGSII